MTTENIATESTNNNDSNVTTETTETTGTDLTSEAIQAALAKTRAAAAASASTEGTATTTEKVKKPKMSDEDKAARDAKRKADQDARKVARDAERAATKAAKDAEKAGKVAHMAKVDKAAANLPTMGETATTHYDDITSNLSSGDVTALIAHLTHYQRAQATATALSVKLEEGQMVRILSGEGSSARYIGQLAKVITVQRIRCYVQPVGTNKSVYLFNSNVAPVTSDEVSTVQSSSGDGESQSNVG
jgi:membrane protein involved in colicin uptake